MGNQSGIAYLKMTNFLLKVHVHTFVCTNVCRHGAVSTDSSVQ